MGNLYGTTEGGGLDGAGVVYKLDMAGNETVLYTFTGQADGANPSSGVIRDDTGNLFGTAYYAGDLSACGGNGCGVVYKVDESGNETVLHTFEGADGANPYAGVIRDGAGNLYGTTVVGGTLGYGTLYKISPAGKETSLSFSDAPGGSGPASGVVRDAAGNLYGTAGGGPNNSGVLYKLDPTGRWTLIHTFTGGADGGGPGDLIIDSAGVLYGTACCGGANNAGLIFKMTSTGQETVLYNFIGGNAGGGPGSLVMDSAGNFYGSAGGGTANQGVIYKVDAAGNETVLHSFTGGTDGGSPNGGVAVDSAGNVYGTTTYGGLNSAGDVFKLDPAGDETVLHNFMCGPADGCQPHAGVVLDAGGNIYGTTFFGGPADSGVVYKLDASGNETILFNFLGGFESYGPTGGNPYDSVILGPAGNLYGTAHFGGTSYYGIVYKLDKSGNQTVLYNFTGGADGGEPVACVILGPAENLYGTTPYDGPGGGGVVFKIEVK